MEVVCLGGKHGQVWGVALTADGNRAASGGLDGVVRLWDVTTGRELCCLEGHKEATSLLAFAPDGRLVSSSWDKTIRIWDTDKATCLEIIEGTCDLRAAAEGASRFPLLAIAGGSETVIKDLATGQDIAWLPLTGITATHPAGRTWVGAAGNHLYLFTLEGGGLMPKGE